MDKKSLTETDIRTKFEAADSLLHLNASRLFRFWPVCADGRWRKRGSSACTKALPIPFPPLSEQRRIVAKVDELMTLVDALDTELTASRTKAAQLMDSVVAELTTV